MENEKITMEGAKTIKLYRHHITEASYGYTPYYVFSTRPIECSGAHDPCIYRGTDDGGLEYELPEGDDIKKGTRFVWNERSKELFFVTDTTDIDEDESNYFDCTFGISTNGLPEMYWADGYEEYSQILFMTPESLIKWKGNSCGMPPPISRPVRARETKVTDDYDYFEVLERYKFLKKSELPDIPDTILERAVMNWMWTKCEDEYKKDNDVDQYEVISSLPKPCQNVYSCRTVIDQVENGGLTQLFFNFSTPYAEMSIDGFLALGAPKLSEVMKKAVETYHQNKPALDSYDDGTQEGFFDSYQENVFEELDNMFYAENRSKNSANYIDSVKYIRQNTDCFGN
jgi:hypothetical protein